MSDREPSKIAHTILNLVSGLTHSYGITTMAKILAGRPSKTIVRKKLHENRMFGALLYYNYEQVLGFLEQLIADGYLAREDVGDDMEIIVIKLTDKGLKAIKGSEGVKLSIPQRYEPEFTSAHDL